MNYDTDVIMRSEVVADCYGGDSCDQVTKTFETYCEGDMDSDTHTEDIVIKLSDLPPGAIIKAEYPCCPECGDPRSDECETNEHGTMSIVGHGTVCECGFDWQEWVLSRYS